MSLVRNHYTRKSVENMICTTLRAYVQVCTEQSQRAIDLEYQPRARQNTHQPQGG